MSNWNDNANALQDVTSLTNIELVLEMRSDKLSGDEKVMMAADGQGLTHSILSTSTNVSEKLRGDDVVAIAAKKQDGNAKPYDQIHDLPANWNIVVEKMEVKNWPRPFKREITGHYEADIKTDVTTSSIFDLFPDLPYISDLDLCLRIPCSPKEKSDKIRE